MDREDVRLKEDAFLENFKVLEKFLIYWFPKTMTAKRKQTWPKDQLIEKVLSTLLKSYNRSIVDFGYEFVLRKRTLRRLWGVMGVHLKAADDVF